MSPPIGDELPETIQIVKGATMTFLRNEAYLTRVVINPEETDPDAKDGVYVPPHWHETHDECFRIVQGRMEVMIGAHTRFYTPEDGEVRVPRGVVHSLRAVKGEAVIVEERTDPMDGEKELFFRNLLYTGKISDNFFEVMQISYWLDMRPVLPGHIAWLETALTVFAGYYIAPLLGYRLRFPSLKKAN